MGSRVLEFEVGAENGGTVLVEVDDPEQAGNVRVSRDVAERTQQSFDAALSEVMPGINVLMSRLQEIAAKPDEVGLEFGIKFTVGANALIAKTAVEGNVKVTLKWQGG
jgi:hypothetical protein